MSSNSPIEKVAAEVRQRVVENYPFVDQTRLDELLTKTKAAAAFLKDEVPKSSPGTMADGVKLSNKYDESAEAAIVKRMAAQREQEAFEKGYKKAYKVLSSGGTREWQMSEELQHSISSQDTFEKLLQDAESTDPERGRHAYPYKPDFKREVITAIFSAAGLPVPDGIFNSRS